MMNPSLKKPCDLKPGTAIVGKWHRNRYTVLKELGRGANGIVYLARFQNKQVALKLSGKGISIASEVNVLKSFAKVRGSALGPSLLDVDDWEITGQKIPFYVMEYIHGPNLLAFVQQKGHAWTGILMLQLLNDLQILHENGWVFGDLKPENLIVTGPPPKVRCIDVGGTTIQGRAIKEFTEFYDRGYWGLGTRKADPQYDLFAAAMVMINTSYPNRFNKTTGGMIQLTEMIRRSTELQKYETVITVALKGDYTSAKEMRKDLLAAMNVPRQKQPGRAAPSVQHSSAGKQTPLSRYDNNQQKKRGGAAETISILLFISLVYFLYLYGQMF